MVEVSTIIRIYISSHFRQKYSIKMGMFSAHSFFFAALYTLRDFVKNPNTQYNHSVCAYHHVNDVGCGP